MEEKNLTDEEIAKALLQQIEYGTGIPYINEWKQVKTVKFTEILDFIQHLQGENEGLKERGEIVINSLHETIDTQKAEIERLTEELATYIRKAGFYYKKCKEYGIENFYDSDLEVD